MPGPARIAAALWLLAASTAMAQSPARETGEWNFTATLDGNPIGTHRFVVSGTPEARSVDSRAELAVRLLGITVYRYRHRAEERWQGDCLRELRADTDDDGKRQQIDQRHAPECVMSFAYWNPRLVTQQRLVDPQTGRVEPVRFERLPDAAIDVEGRPVPAQGWRLQTEAQRISVWYAADGGRWIALDADAKGGRVLRYRLSPAASDRSAPR
jgi:hypothetical protein